MESLKTVVEKATQLGQGVKEFGRAAGERMDDVRKSTGNALHQAAATVRHGSDTIDDIASGTAGRLDAAGRFVRDFTPKNVIAGVTDFGRKHLRVTLFAGIVIGFVAGSALSRAARSRT